MDQHLTPYTHRSHRAVWTPAPVDPTRSYRVGEVERAAACDALAEHYAAGRLDPSELDDRLARAMAARSREDLRVLFVDLAPRRGVPVPAADARPIANGRPGALLPVLASIMIISLLMAGGMLLVLGAVSPALFVAALAGGTATGVAGACATVLARETLARRPQPPREG